MDKDRTLALLLLFLSGLTYYETTKFPELSNDLEVINAAFVPRLLVLFLIISACILFFKSFKNNDNNKFTINLKDSILWRIGAAILVMIGYVILLPLLGFEIASILFLSILMIIFKLNNWVKIFTISVTVMLVVYYVFVLQLNVSLPLRFL
ncbi:MAG: putative tricarboxylic transport rane protein [Clostridia bacterium]|nr:putative tricarboxylic transport rane protein [Clostridia bacterium]